MWPVMEKGTYVASDREGCVEEGMLPMMEKGKPALEEHMWPEMGQPGLDEGMQPGVGVRVG